MRPARYLLAGLLLSSIFLQVPATASNPPATRPQQLKKTSAHPGDGASDEVAFLPDVAGPNSTIVATFEDPESTGPGGQATIAFDDKNGRRTFFQAATDAQHRLAFKVAEGTVAVWLFKHFDASGKPDIAAVKCAIGRGGVIAGTQEIANAARSGPAIVRAATAYERGGASRGLVNLQTRGSDPLDARLLVDGRSDMTQTVAASDMSVKAQFNDNAPLGRHDLAVDSRGRKSNSVAADLVTLRADPVTPGTTGSVQTVTVHAEGLPPSDKGTMYFRVSGSARLESGGETIAVPVNGDTAQVRIRGERAGPALVSYTLAAELGAIAGAAAGAVADNELRTTSRPSEGPAVHYSPEPTPTPTPFGPGDIDKPVIYGHDDYSCQTRYDGWMEPTQGVWQDDVVFPDQDEKQLVRDKDPDRILYHAELGMVAQRDSVIGGVDHYLKNGKAVDVRDRNHVVFKLHTNCTTTAKLHVRFTVRQAVILKQWDDPNVFDVPVSGAPSQKPRDVELQLPAEGGLPADSTFKLENGLSYRITAELMDEKEHDTGIRMDVDGRTIETGGFSVHFVPVILSDEDAQHEALLRRSAEDGSNDAEWINDYYPEKPGQIYGVLEPTLNLSSVNIPDVGSWKPLNHANWVQANRNQALLDAIADRLTVQTLFENGGRVVAVMTAMQFDKTFNPKGNAGAYTSRATAKLPAYDAPGGGMRAQTISYKFIVEPWNNTGTGITGHELAHTLIPGWMKVDDNQVLPAMQSQCKVSPYHDVRTNWAFGIRLNETGKAVRQPKRARNPMMSYPYDNFWIAQCTYWLLLDTLAGSVVDPNVIVVRGGVARAGGGVIGRLGPSYDIRGVATLKANSGGPYHIVARSASGAVIASYGFDAPWKFPEAPIYRTVVPFAFTIPSNPAIATIELDGAGKPVTIRRGATPPPAQILSVRPSKGHLTVTWQAPQGDPSTLLFSSNGRDFVTEEFETTATRSTFRASRHGIIKLLVEQNNRSTTVIRKV